MADQHEYILANATDEENRSVVGVDHDPDAVGRARRLVEGIGLTNIAFAEGDLYSLDGIDDGFDAVVGAVLMHVADPAAALTRGGRLVRPGGLVCMHEGDMTYVGIDTLTGRLDAEVEARGGFTLTPLMIGAWTRLPSVAHRPE